MSALCFPSYPSYPLEAVQCSPCLAPLTLTMFEEQNAMSPGTRSYWKPRSTHEAVNRSLQISCGPTFLPSTAIPFGLAPPTSRQQLSLRSPSCSPSLRSPLSPKELWGDSLFSPDFQGTCRAGAQSPPSGFSPFLMAACSARPHGIHWTGSHVAFSPASCS